VTDDEFKAWLCRQDKPPTKALRQRQYGDPADFIRFEREKGGSMQRDIDEVEILLDLWADWMRKPEGPDGHRVAVGFRTEAAKDSEELYESVDIDLAERVNAAFDSLAPIYKDAIMRQYKLGAQVWRFSKACSFEDAKIVIRVKFVTKGLL
jgi:hypothetical protein